MSSQTDPVLLERYARSGQDADFRPLVDRYAPLVYSACLRRVGRRELAEDATQAVFVLLAQKAPKMRPSVTLAPWLLAASRHISIRLARSERRRQNKERPLNEDLATPELADTLPLAQALGRLRGVERDAVTLRFVHDLSLADVGTQLGISEDAARMRVQRALTRLRRDLAPLSTVPTSLAFRLARPLAASAAVMKLAAKGSLMLNPNLLLLAPAAALLTLGAATLAPSHAPKAPLRQTLVAKTPSASTAPAIVTQKSTPPQTGKKSQAPILKFEDYLGKDQAYFAARFGSPDGATGLGGSKSEASALNWQTYDRRRELGGGKGIMATATYPIGDSDMPMAKLLSIGFDGPMGSNPVATHVDHGIDPRPSRSLEQEAQYVGVNLSDYDAIASDPSDATGALRFSNHKRPEIILEANNLNETWHISLRLDPLRGR